MEISVSLSSLLEEHRDELLSDWAEALRSATTRRADLISDEQVRVEAKQFITLLARATRTGTADLEGSDWDELRGLLGDVSRSRALAGFTPSEIATFVFSFKEPLFDLLSKAAADGGNAQALLADNWRANLLLDRLGLYTTEVYQSAREEIIRRQQQEMLELSTPVVKLWDQILAVPLIGTMDSERTQVVMESLLEMISETSAAFAVIDITGVPTVDTLVAQHLLKTAAAARLMGAEVIISGIRPQIAQTVVQLGVELPEVTTKASIADAFALALRRLGWTVSRNEKA